MNNEYAKLFQDSMKKYHEMLYEQHPFDFKQILEWCEKRYLYFFHTSSRSFLPFGINHDDVFYWNNKLWKWHLEEFEKKSEQYTSFEEYLSQTEIAEVPVLMQLMVDNYQRKNQKEE